MNCGFCGRPVYDGQPICKGCTKSKSRAGSKIQRKYDREFVQKEKDEKLNEQGWEEEDEEDAQDAWAK